MYRSIRPLNIIAMTLAVVVASGSALVSAENFAELIPIDIDVAYSGLPETQSDQGTVRSPCTGQTLLYAQAKTTGLQALSINNATSAESAGQWFDAPGTLTISGVDFYAFITAPDTVIADVSVFAADANKLPTGPALGTTSILITTEADADPTLEELRQQATFASPVVVSAPYVIVVSNYSPTNMGLISNDYTATPADGGSEWLGSVELFGTWMTGDLVNVGGVPFDADWILEPVVDFDLVPSFTPDLACWSGAQSITFTNTTAFALSRFYNQSAFFGVPEQSFSWDFGDGSPPETSVSPTHAFADAGPFSVQLSATITSWDASTCTDTASVNIGTAPTAGFSWSDSGATVDFTDLSTGTDSWLWDFGDGNTSTQQNPSHTYAAFGTYTVCQTSTNGCGPDTDCQAVGPVPVELMSFSID